MLLLLSTTTTHDHATTHDHDDHATTHDHDDHEPIDRYIDRYYNREILLILATAADQSIGIQFSL